jgi:hypothetical protein
MLEVFGQAVAMQLLSPKKLWSEAYGQGSGGALFDELIGRCTGKYGALTLNAKVFE